MASAADASVGAAYPAAVKFSSARGSIGAKGAVTRAHNKAEKVRLQAAIDAAVANATAPKAAAK